MWRVIGLVCLAFIMLAASGSDCGTSTIKSTPTPKAAATPKPMSEEQVKGFHCLSKWDGHHDGLNELVKARLNDPGSLEPIETGIAPVNANKKHAVRMDFTAKNAFGGRVRHLATGWIDNKTCEATLVEITQ